jgi:uracil-DNA glycosylase family 4
VDPKEQLRLYLEQRREFGETELVLDGMTVDEVMKLLGAQGGKVGLPDASTPAAGAPPGPRGSRGPDTDWRTALGGTPPTRKAAALERPVREADAAGAPPPDVRLPPPASPAPTPTQTRESTPRLSLAPTGAVAPAVLPLEQIPAGLVVGSPVHDIFGGASAWSSLGEIASAVGTCTKCPLYKTAKNPVPGEGNPEADFVCVGEAPGATEDEQGRPFVGQAGQLLTKILGAIDLRREDVFICNVLKHRPPGNRNPEPDEVAACSPYLVRQIELLRPKVILALGTFAAQTLLQTRESIGKLRGRIHRYYGVPLIVTYHPAALLRNPSWKRPTWEDVQLARRLLDRPTSA